jgi:hypothetical protein
VKDIVEVIERGANWSMWRVPETTPRLIGASLFGPHDVNETRTFYELFDLELARGDVFHFLADNIRLRPGDHDLATFRATYLGARARMPRVNLQLARWATVSASHATGLAIAGSQKLMGASYPARAFRTYEDAITWLGYPEQARPLADWLRDLPGGEREPDLLARLRSIMHGGALDLGSAARLLGIGSRTLQRRLAAIGTTFRDQADSVADSGNALTPRERRRP